MTLEELEEGLARFGGAAEDWPDDARERAEALIAASPAARALSAAHAALAADLREAGAAARAAAPPPPARLVERVLADAAAAAPEAAPAAPAPGRRRRLDFALRARFGGALRPAAAFALSATLGLWLGYSAPAGVADAATGLVGSEAAVESDEELAMMDLDETAIAADVLVFDRRDGR